MQQHGRKILPPMYWQGFRHFEAKLSAATCVPRVPQSVVNSEHASSWHCHTCCTMAEQHGQHAAGVLTGCRDMTEDGIATASRSAISRTPLDWRDSQARPKRPKGFSCRAHHEQNKSEIRELEGSLNLEPAYPKPLNFYKNYSNPRQAPHV